VNGTLNWDITTPAFLVTEAILPQPSFTPFDIDDSSCSSQALPLLQFLGVICDDDDGDLCRSNVFDVVMAVLKRNDVRDNKIDVDPNSKRNSNCCIRRILYLLNCCLRRHMNVIVYLTQQRQRNSITRAVVLHT
jgi:hypothetical protein